MKQPLTTQCLAVERSKRSEGRVFVVRRATFATVAAAASLAESCRVWVRAEEEGRHSVESADIDQALSVPEKHFTSASFLYSFRTVATTIIRILSSDKAAL